MAAHGFFHHQAFLHARVPRTRCPEHGVHLVAVAWARPESGFTLLFEALPIEFATAMPVARVAAVTREHDTRSWRVLEHHVATASDEPGLAGGVGGRLRLRFWCGRGRRSTHTGGGSSST